MNETRQPAFNPYCIVESSPGSSESFLEKETQYKVIRQPAFNPYSTVELSPSASESFLEKMANAGLSIIQSIGALIAFVIAGVFSLISSIFSSSPKNSSSSSIEFYIPHEPKPSAPPWDPAWGQPQNQTKSL